MDDHISRACQHNLHHKQHRSHEKERKFDRFCNSCHHRSQRCGKHQAAYHLLSLGSGTLIHGKCRSRKSENHENKFTGKISARIRTEMNRIWICQLGEKDILSSFYDSACHFHGTAYACLPERQIKNMMKTKRNQRPLDDPKNKGPEISGFCHEMPKSIDSLLSKRPDIKQ